MDGLDGTLVALVTDLRGVITTAVLVVSGAAGSFYAMVGVWHGYEAGQFRGEHKPHQIALELTVAALLLGFTGFLAATGGAQPGDSGFAVIEFQTGAVSGDAASAANATLQAVMALLAAIGWLSQLRGVIAAYDLGKGRGEVTIWRVLGFIVGGSLLADLPNGVRALDTTLGTALFS